MARTFQIGSRVARLRLGTEVRRDEIGTVGLYVPFSASASARSAKTRSRRPARACRSREPARYRARRRIELDPVGDRIPNAVDRVASLGLTADHPSGWFGCARLRYFGAAPLIEDGSVRSSPTKVVNADVGYRFANGWSAAITGLNLFNSRAPSSRALFG